MPSTSDPSSSLGERTSGGKEERGPARPAGEGATRDWGQEEEDALRLWIALARSYLTFSRVVSSKVLEYGLTIPQFGILEALHHLGPLSLGELADKLLVTGGNITYVMDRLEDQKLVYRERSEEDRRVVKAHLTPEGRELITRVFPGHAAYVRELVSLLTAEERNDLRTLLKKLGKGIAERAEDGGDSPDSGT